MRHLWSLLSGIAAAAVAVAAFGLDDIRGGWVVTRIVGVGLVLGLVAATRLSPVGPIVGGLLLLSPVIMMEVASDLFVKIFLSSYGTELGGLTFTWFQVGRADGYLALAGAMMVVAAVSRQRWLAWPKPVDAPVDNGPVDAAPAAAGPAAGAHDGLTEQLWVQPR